MNYLEQDQPLDREQQEGQPFVAPGFEEVEAAFKANFAQRGEVGAACAIYHRGRLVVDLWDGYRDLKSRTPWKANTLILMMSTTKGMAALAVALANSRGLMDYEERVATYWPEFAQQGKDAITVRQLLARQAGLAVCDEPLTAALLADPDALASVLARQKPAWEPGTRSGYHFHTLGMYESELIRRVDPRHRRLGRFFHEEVAALLGLEFYIGLPADVSTGRIATPIIFNAREALFGSVRWRLALAIILPWTLTHRAMWNPNLQEYVDPSLEMPSGNGIGLVRSIARVYSALVMGGEELGLSKQTVEASPLHRCRQHVAATTW